MRRNSASFSLDENVKTLVKSSYRNAALTTKHLEELKKEYPTVVVRTELIHAAAGDHSIINLAGTFPITFKGQVYKMPLHARILPDYPNSAPVVFLVPAPEMAIMKNHKNIDQTGRCHFPYLSSWSSASTLVVLLRVMVEAFSAQPPLYTRPTALPAQPPNSNNAYQPPNSNNAYQPSPAAAFVPPPAATQPGYGSWEQPQPPTAFVPPPYGSAGAPFVPPAVNPARPGEVLLSRLESMQMQRTQSTPSVAAFVPPSVQQPQAPPPASAPHTADDGDDAVDAKLCIVCFERPKEALITPCNHIAMCLQDANYLKNHRNPCPVCRGPIDGVIRVFLV